MIVGGTRPDSPVERYALALMSALTTAGIEPLEQARDAARNLAGPLAELQDVGVHEAFVERLGRQREHFGLRASDDTIERASRAAAMIERPKGWL